MDNASPGTHYGIKKKCHKNRRSASHPRNAPPARPAPLLVLSFPSAARSAPVPSSLPSAARTAPVPNQSMPSSLAIFTSTPPFLTHRTIRVLPSLSSTPPTLPAGKLCIYAVRLPSVIAAKKTSRPYEGHRGPLRSVLRLEGVRNSVNYTNS